MSIDDSDPLAYHSAIKQAELDGHSVADILPVLATMLAESMEARDPEWRRAPLALLLEEASNE